MKGWMIYGANGYTGELVAKLAASQGMKPILAGRSEKSIRPLAESLSLPFRVFDLSDPEKVESEIRGLGVILHCAGPFSRTSRPMVEACLKAGVHYLDITGEIDVFEHIFSLDQRAKAKGVVLLPGVGFDVVPSDCVAKTLSGKLPDATALELAFTGDFQASPGTLKTMVERLGQPGQIRRGGKIVATKPLSKKIAFPFGERIGFSLPWGDVSTAYHSTGIPDVTVYAALNRPLFSALKGMFFTEKLLALPPVQRLLQKAIETFVRGPGPEALKNNRVWVWGRATNPKGKTVESILELGDSYAFTRDSALLAVKKLLEKELPGGAYTPSMAFGEKFAEEVKACAIG